ncbi:hypothetical protein COLO4_36681 [Corchorus olitorius]|uniref:Putative plant transposon protein domain-containing protein n=1 Tax=Corchorus olitorius TaxID=93759 RepID=A0A1R3G6J4_9ROSI|nr:hypothetical protein COLO4_36681 [Corchorus olitorius]
MTSRTKRKFGASSSAPPSANAPRFLILENEKWYKDKEKHGMVVETYVHSAIESQFKVKEALQRRNWEGILDLKGTYYPELVREFYANIVNKDKEKPIELISYVRGVQITISKETIEQHLKLPKSARILGFSQGAPTDDHLWLKCRAAAKFNGEVSRGKKNKVHLMNFSIQPRLICVLFGKNVMPLKNSESEARTVDLYLLDFLYHESDFPPAMEAPSLPGLMLQSMSKVVRSGKEDKQFVFPILISQLLKAAGVDTSGVFAASTDDQHGSINVAKMENFLYKKHEDLWYNPYKFGSYHPFPGDYDLPPALLALLKASVDSSARGLRQRASKRVLEKGSSSVVDTTVDESQDELDSVAEAPASDNLPQFRTWKDYVQYNEANKQRIEAKYDKILGMFQTVLDRLPPPPPPQ